jgi:hypothetical protein
MPRPYLVDFFALGNNVEYRSLGFGSSPCSSGLALSLSLISFYKEISVMAGIVARTSMCAGSSYLKVKLTIFPAAKSSTGSPLLLV